MDGFTILSQIKTLQDLLLIGSGVSILTLAFVIVTAVRARKSKQDTDGKLRLMQQEAKERREADQAQIAKANQERLLREIDLEVQRDKHTNDMLTRFAAAIEASTAVGVQIGKAIEVSNDLLKEMRGTQNETKQRHEANALRIGQIDDRLSNGIVSLEGRVDGAKAEVTAQGINIMQALNNRTLEVNNSIKQTGDSTQTLVNKLSTTLDTVLLKVNELGTQVAALQANKDDANVQEVLRQVGELFIFVRSAKRGTDPLDPNKASVDPLAIPNTLPKKPPTGDLPPLPPLNPPVAIETPLTTPPAVHDTRQLTPVKPEGK